MCDRRKALIPFPPFSFIIFGMKKKGSLFTFFTRVDVFNRIIVFLAMALFILLPSYVLYYVNDTNNDFNTIMPCVYVLAVVLGNGVFTLYRPLRTSWFFFLESLFVILSGNSAFLPGSTPMPLSENGVVISESLYCILGFLINILFFINYRRRSKTIQAENTHNDNLYDFLGGKGANEEIKEDVIAMSEEDTPVEKMMERAKLSRVVRIASIVVSSLCFLISLISMAVKGQFFVTQLSILTFDGLFILLLSGFCSVLYPKDYKYIYYYNGLLFSLLALISCGNASFSIFPFLIALIAIFLSLLLTLIVEGRTWTGAKPS